MSEKIPLFKIYWDNEDLDLVADCISSGSNWAIGPNNELFEKKISEFMDTKYCVTFNSGTSALHADLIAHGIGSDDEVIVPSFTFIATANAPKFVGAKPVFADIEEDTYGLDPEDVKEKITGKTRAIMPIHFGGCPCKIEELREIADDHNLILIEDAAESFGATVNNKKTGSIGDSSMVSFCQNKIITTGEGGAIVTDSRDLYTKLKLIRSHGRNETCDYFSTSSAFDYVNLGYNFRLSNILASLGVAQMHKVATLIELRRRAASSYTTKLREKCEEIIAINPPPQHHSVHQLYSVRLKNRDGLMKHLEMDNIMSKIYFPPVHLTSYYKNELKYDCQLPITERVSDEILSLPFHPRITVDEIDRVTDSIQKFCQDNPNGSN